MSALRTSSSRNSLIHEIARQLRPASKQQYSLPGLGEHLVRLVIPKFGPPRYEHSTGFAGPKMVRLLTPRDIASCDPTESAPKCILAPAMTAATSLRSAIPAKLAAFSRCPASILSLMAPAAARRTNT